MREPEREAIILVSRSMVDQMDANFFVGLFRHIGHALLFKHDGSGLPGKPTAPFFVLVMTAFLLALARHIAFGTLPAFNSVFRFLVVIAAISVIFHAARYYLISLFLCLSTGIDAIAIVGSLLPKLPALFFFLLSLWESTAFVIGILRITRRLDNNS